MKDSSTWKRVPIKEELFALTKGMIRAAILNQFLYWSERVRDYTELITEEEGRTALMPETELECGWIYKKLEELDSEIMAGLTPQGLKPHIEYLIENGWLLRRRNPKVKWDKTYQYRVNIIKVQSDLLDLGYHLEGYKYQSIAISFSEVRTKNIEVRKEEFEVRSQNTEIRTKENHDSNQDILSAIPEITIETTTDITSDNTIENTPYNTFGDDFSFLENKPEEGIAVQPNADMKMKITMDMHPGLRIWQMANNSVYKVGAVVPKVMVNKNQLPEITEKLEQIWTTTCGNDLRDAMIFYLKEQRDLKEEPDVLTCLNNIISCPDYWKTPEQEEVIW